MVMRLRVLLRNRLVESDGIAIELARVPAVGEFIATDSNVAGGGYQVQLVVWMPVDAPFAATIIGQVLSLDDLHALASVISPSASATTAQVDALRMLTVEEAGKFAKVSPWTIRRLIERGKLPASNFGSGRRDIYRIKLEDLSRVQPFQPPPPRERPRRRTVAANVPSRNVWPPEDVVAANSGNAWPPTENRILKKSKRGHPRILTDEERAAKDRAKKEKFQQFLKERMHAPLKDLGE
jgi:excisionase family DNA binding protein